MNEFNTQNFEGTPQNFYEQTPYITPPPKKSNTPLIITLVALCVVAALSAAAIIFFMIHNSNEKASIPPTLTITSCPSEVDATEASVTIQGTMCDENTGCALSIDGEVIETLSEAGTSKSWSKNYAMTPGETRTFTIVLKNDNNQIVAETRSVYCRPSEEETASASAAATAPAAASVPAASSSSVSGPLTSGCEFVKKKTQGLNIREYAGTAYEVVDYIAGNDYTSRMVFTGYYEVDSAGYTWYQVISPNGKYGYVRSDLVKRVS